MKVSSFGKIQKRQIHFPASDDGSDAYHAKPISQFAADVPQREPAYICPLCRKPSSPGVNYRGNPVCDGCRFEHHVVKVPPDISARVEKLYGDEISVYEGDIYHSTTMSWQFRGAPECMKKLCELVIKCPDDITTLIFYEGEGAKAASTFWPVFSHLKPIYEKWSFDLPNGATVHVLRRMC